MIVQAMTLDQVRQLGIEALNRELGAVGMIRFMQQSETGWGDYTKDREQWLGDPELRELFEAIKASETESKAATKNVSEAQT